jgi:hypothetical protein
MLTTRISTKLQPYSQNAESIVIATTTWNSSDIIEQFLEHHLAGDIARIFLMDFGSADATLDIVQPYCDQGVVELLRLPSLHCKDSSNLLLNHIRSCQEQYDWCLFIDPDEFLSHPGTLVSTLAVFPEEVPVVNLRRFNVTGLRPKSINHPCVPFADLDLKIKLRSQRSVEDRRARKLNPAWIFTDIPGKVAVRVKSDASVGDGDHTAQGNTGLVVQSQDLLHFPIRSWEKFEEKIGLAKQDFDANPHLSPHFGWHLRRWIAIREDGELASEFLKQFIDPADVERLVQTGVLERIVQSTKPPQTTKDAFTHV